MKDIKGVVANAESCSPVDNVEIIRKDISGNFKEKVFSDSKGRWNILSFGDTEEVIFKKKGFVSKRYKTNKIPSVVRLLDDRLIGYQEKLWFRPGEKVSVYVHSPIDFRAKLFRHGLSKECILDFGKHKAFSQNVADGYFVESGLDWRESFFYIISDNVMPGICSLLLEAEGQKSFAIPFIIATKEKNYAKRSKLLVLASTNTWQAYNLWGGRSRYRNFESDNSDEFMNIFFNRFKYKISQFLPQKLRDVLKGLFPKFSGDKKWYFKKLSVRRPFTNCSLEEKDVLKYFNNHLAAGEWRLLAWLEREKIPYDIISGEQLHRTPKLLAHYSAIILSTHCEYWSRQMYEALKHFHEKNKLWILNISGNSIYREVEFFGDHSIRCVNLSLHRSCADETQILGVRFSLNDYGTCAPYKVLLEDHWVFKNITFVGKAKVFGFSSLNRNVPVSLDQYDAGRTGLKNGLQGNGASGWETDKISKTAPKDIKVIAKGMNSRGGADMVIRDPQGLRGGMFSVSSLVFSGCLLIDDVAARIVKNVISAIELQ